MKQQFLFILCLFLITQSSIAQTNKKLNDARFLFRPMIYLDYNLYHWVQEPSILGTTPKNVGQVFNVVPGLGAGFLLGKKTVLMFSLDAAIHYMPFSLDLAGYEGMGSLSFPVVAGFRIPLEGFFFLTIGGGVQWTQTNLHQRIATKSYSNAFFMTYLGEVGFGIEENIFLAYFLRFGYNSDQAMSFDVGVKLGLNGSLWE